MANIHQSTEVNVPIEVAYHAWSRFEHFPRFMEGVEEVEYINERLTHWKVSVAGHDREYDAEITALEPNQVIAWRATTEPFNAGRVVFESLSPGTTLITVDMEYEPETVTERVGDFLGLAGRRVEGDLKRFKEFVESGETKEQREAA